MCSLAGYRVNSPKIPKTNSLIEYIAYYYRHNFSNLSVPASNLRGGRLGVDFFGSQGEDGAGRQRPAFPEIPAIAVVEVEPDQPPGPAAQGVLEARAKYPDASLAALYDPLIPS